MIKWTISIVPSALADSYKIPRGAAADVTNAISALGKEQKPHGYEKVEEYEDTYKIKVGEYTIEYKLIEDERVVKVLVIR